VQTANLPTRFRGVRPRTAGATRLQVVVAEDDWEMRRLLAETLRADGYDVTDVKNGSELLEFLDCPEAIRSLHAIVTDVRMPGITGLQALAWLQHVSVLRVPVVVITAFGDRQVHEQAARLGADVLEKPFELDELRARIRKLPLASR
jgi:DNA-binding response OmpR family regulator